MKAFKRVVQIIIKLATAAALVYAAYSVTTYYTSKEYIKPVVYEEITQEQINQKGIEVMQKEEQLSAQEGILQYGNEVLAQKQEELEVYQNAMEKSEGDPNQLLEQILFQYHVENEEYQLLIKELIMGCFGYDIPQIDYQDTASENIRSTMQDFAAELCMDEWGIGNAAEEDEDKKDKDEKIRSVVGAALKGAWNADTDKLEAAWDGAKEQAFDILQEELKDKAMSLLGEKITGVIGTVQTYVEGIQGFYEAFTEDNSSSSVAYLEKDIVAKIEEELGLLMEYMDMDDYSSEDMATLVYLFHEYGSDIDELNRIAGEEVLSGNWIQSYEMMELACTNYQKNKELINLLEDSEPGRHSDEN